MTSQSFTFPPPPPPPPKAATPTSTYNQPTFLSNESYWRGGGLQQNHGRGRGRGDFARGGRGASRRSPHLVPSAQNNGYYSTAWVRNGSQSWQQHLNKAVGAYVSQGSIFQPLHANTTSYERTEARDQSQPLRGQKRQYSTAFETKRPSFPQTPAAPAVPSFGAPLPTLQQPPWSSATSPNQKASNKKKRQHNQLGLTPRTEEHESSEEDNDVDEEARLAASGYTNTLQFSYKGQTSTLQSAAEVAAWIAERKRNYPTKVRTEQRQKEAEERKKSFQEARKVREEAARRRKAEQKERADQARKAKEQKDEKDNQLGQEGDVMDEATKAKVKAEKNRRKALKEDKRAAKAEEEAKLAQLRASAWNSIKRSKGPRESFEEKSSDAESAVDSTGSLPGPESVQASSAVASSLLQQATPSEHLGSPQNPTTTSLPSAPVTSNSRSTRSASISSASSSIVTTPSSALSISDSSSNLSICLDDDDDFTSSSGSSSLSSSSDAGSDSSPETFSAKNPNSGGPIRAPGPRNQQQICRQFQKSGDCPRGERCKFLHTRDKGSHHHQHQQEQNHGKKRKGLYQVLVEKEKEEERKKVLRAIVYLGEAGVLGQVGNEGLEKKIAD